MKQKSKITNSYLPKRPQSHVTGDQAILALRNAIPKEWIFREASSDYGIDCEIEVVADGGSVTGAIIKGQVKGTVSTIVMERNGLSVATDSIRYWISLPVPVIIVLVTENSHKVLWLDVREYLREEDRLDSLYMTKRKTLFFNFRDAYSLPNDITKLESIALQHQINVSDMHMSMLGNDTADFWGYVILIELFNGDPDAMIQWLREKGSIDQLMSDLPFLVWVKEQADQDSEFLQRVREMVEKADFLKDIN